MLELAGLGRRFGRTWAVRDVSATFQAGERVALVGPNGSGKTTLLDLMSGLARPTEGRVLLEGAPVREDLVDLKARVGYVRHAPGLYDLLTVRENLVLAGRLHGLERGEAADRAERMAGRLGIAVRFHDRVSDLSRGLTQRAALAFALVPWPDALLLDEPLTGLDADAARRLRQLLSELASDRLVVTTAHRVEEAPDAQRVVFLADGEVTYDGPHDGAIDHQAKVYGGMA